MRSTCMYLSSATKMATFNAKAFEKKLNSMDLSQTSIQTVSLWIIHHRHSIKEIIAVWIEMMKKAKLDRKLGLLYLANDVVQNSRKKSKELIVYFGKAFKEVFLHLNDKKINNQVERVLKIWDERRVYEKDFLEKLRSVHSSGKKEKQKASETIKVIEKPPEKVIKPKAPLKPLPDDFKMSTVMNMIVSMKELESELSVQDTQMSSLKVDDLETVKQVKDRSGVNKFVKEFEESKEKLDTYCNKLSRCINEKRVLIDMLHNSETYYDAAYEEAKVIVHAYKTFGSRLTSMKRKVESKVKRLKVQWIEKQKEIEEKKNSNPEFELEPISDAEEPNDFQADNTDVLDMDLGSDSEVGTPEGPLYDPSSVMYDPNDAGKDYGDIQPSKEDGDDSVAAKIDIPNPEDVFRNIVGQEESSAPALFKPMGILIDGKLQTVSLSDGNMIVGSEDRKETSVIHVNTTSSMSSLSTNKGVIASSLTAMEPSGNFLNNEAMSPISDDSVPSPEGTPEGLVLEKDDEPVNQFSSLKPDQQLQNNFSNVMGAVDVPQTVMQSSQFISGDQFVGMTGNENWSMTAPLAPMQLVPNPMGNLSEIPPPQMIQSFSGVSTTNLSFEQPVPAFIGDNGNLGPPFAQIQQGNNLIDQFQLDGSGGMMPPQNIQMQLQGPDIANDLPADASTTPTQDESIEPNVRPIDILTQLLNKGRKTKKDHEPSVEKDREKEHRSKDHGKHKKSSRRRSSDRHHSSESKESSNDRSDSHHSSSKRSHHRRKSRGHSKEKHSSYSNDRADRREGSIENYDDDPVDSYLKSPKISRMQSKDSVGGSEEVKTTLPYLDSFDESNPSTGGDAVEVRPVTIFDQRRNDDKLKMDETSVSNDEKPPYGISDNSFKQSPETPQVGSVEDTEKALNLQHPSGMDVFPKQLDSFEEQIPSKQNDFQLHQESSSTSGSVQNTEQWTLSTSKPDNQMEFYFDSRRSPTPEMDHYRADLPVSQPQQPHLIPPHFQQPDNFCPGAMPQFDSQPGVLFSEASIAPQVSMAMGPNVSMEQTGPFSQGITMEQQLGDRGMQQQNMQVTGFQVQPMFNQQPLERPFLHEPRIDSSETMVAGSQQGDMMPPGVNPGFRSVEQPPVSNIHFGTQDSNLQGPLLPPGQPPVPLPQSPFQQERPFFRGDPPEMRQERPFFQEMQSPNIRHEMPPLFNDPIRFGRENHQPFTGKPEGFGNHGDNFRQNFERQRSREEFNTGESINTNQGNNKMTSERNSNFGHDNQQQAFPSEGKPIQDPPHVYQDFNARQDDFVEDSPHPSANFEHSDDMLHDEPFQRKNHELNGHYDHFDSREPIRPRFPQPNMPMRSRFRPRGPNLALRGPRPHRMFRPPGNQHQRPRFRPPMPRARIPQGYMPRRPVF